MQEKEAARAATETCDHFKDITQHPAFNDTPDKPAPKAEQPPKSTVQTWRSVQRARMGKRPKAWKTYEQRVPLARHVRSRIMRYLSTYLRWRKGGRDLTSLHYRVAHALMSCLGDTGRLDVSHDYLSRMVGCSTKTVQRALLALEKIGVLTWCHRYVRIEGERSPRRTSNGYVWVCPDHAAQAIDDHYRQFCRRSVVRELSSLLSEKKQTVKPEASPAPIKPAAPPPAPPSALDLRLQLFRALVEKKQERPSDALFGDKERR